MTKYLIALLLTVTTAYAEPLPQPLTASPLSYDLLIRRPMDYLGWEMTINNAKVVQIAENGERVILRVAVTQSPWRNIMMIGYVREPSESRILENDVISLQGKYTGITSYESLLGTTVQIPSVLASKVTVVGKAIRIP